MIPQREVGWYTWKLIPPKTWAVETTQRNPGGCEVTADIVASTLAGDFTNLSPFFLIRTNHLVRDVEPAGGNVLFLDFHVQWRDFADMEIRFDARGSWARNFYF